MEGLTKSGLIAFIEMAITKGMINSNTGGSWKAACAKVLEELGPDDSVSDVDVQSEVLRYNNRHPGDLSPTSLRAYENRVANAIAQFLSYKQSPTTYKAPSRSSTGASKGAEPRKRDKTPSVAAPRAAAETTHTTPPPLTGMMTDTSLIIPFPLRPTFQAQIVIPKDLTKAEADRLCMVIQAFAQDHPPVTGNTS